MHTIHFDWALRLGSAHTPFPNTPWHYVRFTLYIFPCLPVIPNYFVFHHILRIEILHQQEHIEWWWNKYWWESVGVEWTYYNIYKTLPVILYDDQIQRHSFYYIAIFYGFVSARWGNIYGITQYYFHFSYCWCYAFTCLSSMINRQAKQEVNINIENIGVKYLLWDTYLLSASCNCIRWPEYSNIFFMTTTKTMPR